VPRWASAQVERSEMARRCASACYCDPPVPSKDPSHKAQSESPKRNPKAAHADARLRTRIGSASYEVLRT